MTKGRYREFFQCDFDIAGTYDAMIPDVECVRIVYEILSKLDVGNFAVKVNHRQILDGMFRVCGVPSDKFRSICSSVDKLDKLPWEEVKQEMVNEKGLDDAAADRIGEYVKLSGGMDLIETLKQDSQMMADKDCVSGISDMETLLEYCDLYGVQDKVVFDLSLARGLDYYTGVIYEAVLKGVQIDGEEVSVGSVAGGGRYDGLVGMFDSKSMCLLPTVNGSSLFLSRRMPSLPLKSDLGTLRSTWCLLTRSCAGEDETGDHVVGLNIKTEHSYKKNPKILVQLQECESAGIPLAVVIGGNEIERGVVKLRDVELREEVEVSRDDLLSEIRKRLNSS
ncbi:hypothetical protein EB796_002315 [Bugula neritina]|uniref:histidine--tRNA ligase n=1 Tax=Bugula neritina TaxID=10212 RepID=A0A7J7KMG2_BUGNE|nr:hypothetical protein EB796_002315 [Bugula neritina]